MIKVKLHYYITTITIIGMVYIGQKIGDEKRKCLMVYLLTYCLLKMKYKKNTFDNKDEFEKIKMYIYVYIYYV
jgi:hypothetical protein